MGAFLELALVCTVDDCAVDGVGRALDETVGDGHDFVPHPHYHAVPDSLPQILFRAPVRVDYPFTEAVHNASYVRDRSRARAPLHYAAVDRPVEKVR